MITNLPGAEHGLLSVSDQALLAEQVAVGALRHLLERKLAIAAAALDQLTVLRKDTNEQDRESFISKMTFEHFYLDAPL